MIAGLIDIFNNPTIAAVLGAVTGALATVALTTSISRESLKLSNEDRRVLASLHKVKDIKNFNYIEPVFRRLLKSLDELSFGRYTIEGLAQVVVDDRETMKSLSDGETLLTMTPLPKSADSINKYIEDELHISVVNEIKNCINRGVIIRKVYVLDKYEDITQELRNEINDLEVHDITVRIVTRQKLQNYGIRETDIVVFGSKKASVGETGTVTPTCAASTIFTDEGEINVWVEKYKSIYNLGVAIREVGSL